MSEDKQSNIKQDTLISDSFIRRFKLPEYLNIVSAKDGIFVYNRYDNCIGKALENYGEWCSIEVGLLTSFMEEGDVVIDVGAFIGTHTIPFAKKIGPQGRVFSFEPQRFNYYNLCTNVFLNGLTNVVSYQFAAGKQSSTVLLPNFAPNQSVNFGAVKINKFKEGEIIPVIPLDNLDIDVCKLIKIDVEGMEFEVLEGARKTIERCRPILYVENNTIENSETILKTLESLNYQCYWTFEQYYKTDNFFECPINYHMDGGLSINLFCVHSTSKGHIPLLEPVLGVDDNWQKALIRQLRRS